MKKQVLAFLSALLLLAGASLAQSVGTVGVSRRITYASAFEEAALAATPAMEKAYLAQLLAISPGANDDQVEKAAKMLANLYAQIDATKPAGKPLARQARTVFELVHKSVLLRYDDQGTFDQTIANGAYNSVSAAAIYALVFEHYKFPYAIKQSPTHVNVVADPNGSPSLVEPAEPQGSYLVPDARFKKSYADYLTDNKSVSAQEVTRIGAEEVFKQQFQATKTITLPQLVALQYFNQGFVALSKDDGPRAYQALLKAEKLHSTTETRYLLLESLRQQLVGVNYTTLPQIELLTEYYARQPAGKMSEETINDFKGLTQRFLLDKGDTATYRAVYQTFQRNLPDTTTRSAVSYVYFMQRGRMKMLQQNNQAAFPLLMQAYRYNTSSPELQGLISSVVHEENSRSGGGIRMLRMLDAFVAQNPRQKGVPLLAQAYLFTYGRAAFDYYGQGKRTEGKKYLTLFEQAQTVTKDPTLTNDLIANVYLAASIAAGEARDMVGVKTYARKGLAFDPSNAQLRQLATMK